MRKIENAGLRAITTSKERQELRAVGTFPIGPVKLIRTINQSDFQGGWLHLWRLVGPMGHPYMNSEIAFRHVHANGHIEWLRAWEGRKMWPGNPLAARID